MKLTEYFEEIMERKEVFEVGNDGDSGVESRYNPMRYIPEGPDPKHH